MTEPRRLKVGPHGHESVHIQISDTEPRGKEQPVTRLRSKLFLETGSVSNAFKVTQAVVLLFVRGNLPLTESDSVLGANGNKWEAHSGATTPGQFCAFDSAQGRAVRNFYTDFANEVV